jgi:hypothetical protein
MLTRWLIYDRDACMVRSASRASVRQRQAGRAGVLLALSALLGQLLIAVPHQAERSIAGYASDLASDVRSAIGSDAGHAARPHDLAQCPSCQAAAHGRNALGATSIAPGLPVPPRREVVPLVSEDVPGALARLTAPPRAPPV